MTELEINARFDSLVEQRNNALNTVVMLQGNLAVAQATIVELHGLLQQKDQDAAAAAAAAAAPAPTPESELQLPTLEGSPANA